MSATDLARELGTSVPRVTFFFHEPVDLGEVSSLLSELGEFAVTHEVAGTLKGLFRKGNSDRFG